MEFNVLKQPVCVNELIYEGSVEQAVDSDITLPDYCPDIQRILKCTLTPRIASTAVSGDRITVDGAALVRIIYVCDAGRIRCFEQNLPFSKHVEAKNLTADACARVRAKTEYVNCRAVSQRRADVHGSLSLAIRASVTQTEELIDTAEGCGVELRKKTLLTSSVAGCTERAFTVSEVMEIGASNPAISQIINASASTSVQEIKVINNKILLKGELSVKTTYCSEDADDMLEKITHSIPISQIIEADGIDDTCRTDLRLEVTSLETVPKCDTDGDMRLLDIIARISAYVCATREVEAPVITDAYSTKYELTAEKRVMEFSTLLENFTDTALCRGSLDISSSGVSSVLDLWCSDITTNAVKREELLVVSGTITICMLILDGDSVPGYLERQVDYEYTRRTDCGDKNIQCDPNVSATAVDYVMGAGDKLDTRIELSITASVSSLTEDKVIVSIQPDEDNPKKNPAAALTIYFCDVGENVWNIARKYNTTVSAIMAENELAEETVAEKRMLLIPGTC